MGLDSGTVLIAITLVVLPIAAVSFALSGGAWRRIGKGGLSIEERRPAPRRASAAVEKAEQEAEARQMLEAKSERRVARGEEPLDVEAELRALLAEPGGDPGADEELREEVRRLVVARNERRRRRGEPELDVEAETARQLAEFA